MQYDYLYVFGAVCPQTGQSSGLLAPWVNTSVVNAFLREFSSELAPEVHLPESWANDPARRKKAGIPDDVVYRKKTDMALDQVWHSRLGMDL